MASSPLVQSEVKQIITALAAGADQRLFSSADWDSRLSGVPGSRVFMRQLRQEWRPSTPPDDFCRKMVDVVREHLHKHNGGPHIWAHTLRVTGNALMLASEADVEPQFAFLLGLFHDVGKLDEGLLGETHEEIGARIVTETLSATYSKSMVKLMAAVISKDASAINPFMRVLHDADKLDKIGATGIARRLSTQYGSQHVSTALRRVRSELETFRPMTFTFSKEMAEQKKDFTYTFLNAVSQWIE